MDGLNETSESGQKPVQMQVSDSPDANLDRSKQGDDASEREQDPARAVQLRAKARWEYEMGIDEQNRKNHVEDCKFVWERGAQWNEQIRRQRETAKPPRPWLEFNQCGQFVKQIVNDQRQNQPAIKVRPKGSGANQKIAELMSGVVRDIEYCSTAPAIYDSDIEQAVTGGRGYHRIVTEWEREDSFNQVLRLRPIPDAMSVILDSSTIQPDKSDARYGFVLEWLDQDTYEDEWPDQVGAISWDDSGSEYSQWFLDGKVCVADYYEVVEEQIELLALSDGRTMWRDDFERSEVARKAATPAPGVMGEAIPQSTSVIVRQEMRSRKRVDWYKVSASDLPLAKYEWLGKYVPIVMCPGDEITISGRKIYQGIIRRLRDAQMMYNYWFTLATERIALAPKAPFIALDGQIEGHPEWKDANTENYSTLAYEPVQIGDQWYVTPPGRTESIQIDQGLVTMMQLCAQNLREITGMKEAALGSTQEMDKPWRAILAEQRKGDTASFHYSDNLSRAIALTGRILVDLIPKIYDAQRIVTSLSEDGTQSPVTVNQAMPDGQVLNNLGQGEYDVVCDTGPAFATRRVEAAAEMKEFMSILPPPQATAMGAIVAKSVDWPGDTGEKISALLISSLPPEQQAIINGGDSQDPQVIALQGAMQAQQKQFQQIAAAAAQHISQLTQELQEVKLQVANKTMEFAAKLTEQATKRQDMSQARAMESENNAQQIYTDKMDNMSRFMDNFVKALQSGVDPNALTRMAMMAVEGAAQNLRTGPDFSQSMNTLMNTAAQGNQEVNTILGAVLPNGVPNPLAPQAPQGSAGPSGPPPAPPGGPAMPTGPGMQPQPPQPQPNGAPQ